MVGSLQLLYKFVYPPFVPAQGFLPKVRCIKNIHCVQCVCFKCKHNMCVCVCVCVCVCSYVNVCISMSVHMCVCVCLSVHVCAFQHARDV